MILVTHIWLLTSHRQTIKSLLFHKNSTYGYIIIIITRCVPSPILDEMSVGTINVPDTIIITKVCSLIVRVYFTRH